MSTSPRQPAPLKSGPVRLRPWAGAALGIAVAVALAGTAGWHNFATADEPYHLLAAWTYVAEGHGDFNPEHPPLTKLVAGAALLPLPLRGAEGPPVQRLAHLSWEVRRFLHANLVPAQRILRYGRVAMLPFLGLLLVGVYLWGRELGGPTAGHLALLAVASQPLVLGHAFVVHTDVAAAATWVWTARAAHRCLLQGQGRGVALGLWLAAALLVKFSALFLVLGVALAALLAAWRRGQPRLLVVLGRALAVAALAVPAGYAPVLRRATPQEVAATWVAYLKSGPGVQGWVERVAAVPLLGKGLVQWGIGVGYVAHINRVGQGINYFFGRTSTTGFWAYFPVALLLKVSLPFAVVLAGAVVAAARGVPGAAVPMLPAAYYLAVSLGSSYNIGARHLLPTVALAGVAGGVAAAGWPRWTRAAVAAALAAAPLLAFPHYLSHFNELLGPERGSKVLVDSNLDWGQDWERAARLARARGWTPITVVYLGSADPASLFPGGVDYLAAPARRPTPYVAISRHAAAVGAEYLAALREPEAAQALLALAAELRQRGRRLAVVGHSIEIYQVQAPR